LFSDIIVAQDCMATLLTCGDLTMTLLQIYW